MNGFILKSPILPQPIRFRYYLDQAPVTCTAFEAILPFTVTLIHARVSGQEIWTDSPPTLDIIQENASVFAEPGEVVFGPLHPKRAKTSNCMGIYYGEGKGLDACNIFAAVYPEDRDLLIQIGNAIWQDGRQACFFDHL